MIRILIEYCVECLFLGRALEVAQALLNEYAEHIESLTLKPGHDGVFDVFVNDQLVITVGETGMPPGVEAITKSIRSFLRSKSAYLQGGARP